MKAAIIACLFLAPCVVAQVAPFGHLASRDSWTPLMLAESDSLVGIYEADYVTTETNYDSTYNFPNMSSHPAKWGNGVATTPKPRWCDSSGAKFMLVGENFGTPQGFIFSKESGQTWGGFASVYVVWMYYNVGNPSYRDIWTGTSGLNEAHISVSNQWMWMYTAGMYSAVGLPGVTKDSSYLSYYRMAGNSQQFWLNNRGTSATAAGQSETAFRIGLTFIHKMRIYAVYIVDSVLDPVKHELMRQYIKKRWNVNL